MASTVGKVRHRTCSFSEGKKKAGNFCHAVPLFLNKDLFYFLGFPTFGGFSKQRQKITFAVLFYCAFE